MILLSEQCNVSTLPNPHYFDVSAGAMVFLSDQNNGTPMGQQDIKMSAFKEMELRYCYTPMRILTLL